MENLTMIQALEISEIISKQVTNFLRVQLGEWFLVYKAQTKSFETKITIFSNLMFEVEFTNRIYGQKVKFSKGNFNDENLRTILENDNILDLIS